MFKKMIVPALVLAATSVAAIPAAAQSYHGPSYNQGGHGRPPVAAPAYNNWQSINQRQVSLDRRIDRGVRDGSLSRREATRLRGEFNSLARLEVSYRRGGLSAWERNDLDRRFDRLSAQIRSERWDRDDHRGRDDHRRH